MPNQLAIYLVFTLILIAAALFGAQAGRAAAERGFRQELQREFERGKRMGFNEARRVAELNQQANPPIGRGYVSNTMKRSGH